MDHWVSWIRRVQVAFVLQVAGAAAAAICARRVGPLGPAERCAAFAAALVLAAAIPLLFDPLTEPLTVAAVRGEPGVAARATPLPDARLRHSCCVTETARCAL